MLNATQYGLKNSTEIKLLASHILRTTSCKLWRHYALFASAAEHPYHTFMTSHLYMLHYVKTWRHLQNGIYIIYCIVVSGGLNHSRG